MGTLLAGLMEPEHGSRVSGGDPLFVSLLVQEVTVKEGSLGFGTQQVMPCEGAVLAFLRCGIGRVHRSWSFMIFAGVGENQEV